MLFIVNRSVMRFPRVVVTDSAANAAGEILLGTLFRTFNSQPVREKIQ